MDRGKRLPSLILILLVISLWFLFEQWRAVEMTSLPNVQSRISSSDVTGCVIPEWNTITTEEIPNEKEFRSWIDDNFGVQVNIIEAESRLLSAFVYPDQISIVTTAQHTYGRNVTCIYYDCNRKEIPNSQFLSVVIPMTTVTCARRKGAQFVSLRFNETEEAPEPIPLILRVTGEAQHELSVCVGPLYGNESKWLQLVEYVEHYRLLDASFFYFTLFEVNEYDRKVIDDYERLGMAESTSYVTEYLKLGWQFHLIQTHECHHRSRFHSKWVINVDIDERLVYTGPGSLIGYLRSLPPYISEVSFSTNRVLKTEQLPIKYTDMADLEDEMMTVKYRNTTEKNWYNLKGIIRPDLVALLFYHWSFRQLNDTKVMSVPKRFGHIRHYRSTNKEALNGNWQENYTGDFEETRLDKEFEEKLMEAVKRRVRYVYEQRMIHCEEIPDWIFNLFSRTLLDCKFKNETI